MWPHSICVLLVQPLVLTTCHMPQDVAIQIQGSEEETPFTDIQYIYKNLVKSHTDIGKCDNKYVALHLSCPGVSPFAPLMISRQCKLKNEKPSLMGLKHVLLLMNDTARDYTLRMISRASHPTRWHETQTSDIGLPGIRQIYNKISPKKWQVINWSIHLTRWI